MMFMRNIVTLVHEYFVESNEALSSIVCMDYMRQAVDIILVVQPDYYNDMKNMDILLDSPTFMADCQRYLFDLSREANGNIAEAVPSYLLKGLPMYCNILDAIMDEIAGLK